MARLLTTAKTIGLDALRLYRELLVTMVPVLILVKVAVEFGLLEGLTYVLDPVMGLAGLPAATAIVWATGLLVGTYAAGAALIGILPVTELTVAQVTVMLSMVLIAHALPVEQSISRRAGISFLFSSGLRFGAAVIYGIVLAAIYDWGGWLQQPFSLTWLPGMDQGDVGWADWAMSMGMFLFSLFWIILGLIILLKILDLLGVNRLLSKLLAPVLGSMGISRTATSITVVGVLLGLTFGGGLIIKEARAGNISPRDIVLSLSFMGLCHSLIEDPLFMMAMGADVSGVLIGRLVFAVLVMVILSRLMRLVPEPLLLKFLYHPPRRKPA